MPTLTMKNLTFAYPGQAPLFDHVNLTLDTNWRLGLLGRNGRGKTTLLKLLLGQLRAQGTVTTPVAFEYYPHPVADPDQLTLFALQATSPAEQWEIERELAQLNCEPTILWQPFATLSGGEQTKALLALAFADPRRFVLLDEPTNHLDAPTRAVVANYLRHKKQGYIVTSHDRRFLDQVIDHVLAIEATQLTLQQGNATNYRQQKARRDQTNAAQNQRLKKEIVSLHQAAEQRRHWAQQAERKKERASHGDKGFLGAKAARAMKRSQNLVKRLNDQAAQRQGLLANLETSAPLTMAWQAGHHATVLTARHLTLALPTHSLGPIDFTLKRGEQLIITGPNGCGKTSLLRSLQHAIDHHTPTTTLQFTPELKLATLPQQVHFAHQSLREYAKEHQLDYPALLNFLFKLGMARAEFTHATDELSFGQQRKLALATCLLTPANLYFLDEPFNYLDLINQDQILALLKQVRPTMLLVEHDPAIIAQLGAPTLPLNN